MGGNAIKISTRIQQENVESTLQSIYKNLLPVINIDINDIVILGSTGKKYKSSSSGDIDLAINKNSVLYKNNIIEKDLFNFLYNKLISISFEIKDMRQMNIISIAWPISNYNGNQPNQYVQLDLMIVDSIEWAKWAFYSPAEWESPYKGLFRNEIMYSVAKYMNYKVIEIIDNINVTWERSFFDLNKGLLRGTQTILGKRGITKTIKTNEKILISNDPDEVVKMMFGDNCKKEELLTWEETFAKIISPDFIHRDKILEILLMTKTGIINKGQTVPKELNDYLLKFFD